MPLTILVPRTHPPAPAAPRLVSPRAAPAPTPTPTESPLSTAHAVDVVRTVIALHGEEACRGDPVESAEEWRLDVSAPFDAEATVPKLQKVAPGLVFVAKEGGEGGEVGTLVFPKRFKTWVTALDVAVMVVMVATCALFAVLKGREGVYDFVR